MNDLHVRLHALTLWSVINFSRSTSLTTTINLTQERRAVTHTFRVELGDNKPVLHSSAISIQKFQSKKHEAATAHDHNLQCSKAVNKYSKCIPQRCISGCISDSIHTSSKIYMLTVVRTHHDDVHVWGACFSHKYHVEGRVRTDLLRWMLFRGWEYNAFASNGSL